MGILNTSRAFIEKNSTTILTAFSVAGVVTTAVLAAKASPKAHQIIVDEELEMPTPLEYIQFTWKCYIPAFIMGTTTIACIIGANTVNVKRNAALIGAYSLADTSLKEYQSKVSELFGEKEASKVRESLAEDRLAANPLSKNTVIVTGRGDMLCYDSLSGRYFKSDMESLRKAQNDLNQELLSDNWVTLNTFYDMIGLEGNKVGETLGWISDNMVELKFDSKLADDGTPCIVVDYVTDPKDDYYKSLGL